MSSRKKVPEFQEEGAKVKDLPGLDRKFKFENVHRKGSKKPGCDQQQLLKGSHNIDQPTTKVSPTQRLRIMSRHRSHLHTACVCGDLISVIFLLSDERTDLLARDDDAGRTPLHLACKHGHCEIVRWMRPRLGNVDIVDDVGRTPLHLACQRGQVNAIELLLEFGADSQKEDNSGLVPLHLAIESKQVEVVRFFLDRGVDVNTKVDGEYSLLHSAVRHKSEDITRLLLDRGADIDAPLTKGFIALHIACGSGSYEIARLLIDRGADVEAKATDAGYTPLHLACANQRIQCVWLLLNRCPWLILNEL